jgi:glutamine synthetase type III
MSSMILDPGFDINTELNEVRLETALQMIMERNDVLIKENEMLAAHLFRQNPTVPAEDVAAPVETSSERALSLQEKLDLILQEEMAINEDISDLTERANQDINSLKEVLEESCIRCNEIKKDAYELRRDLMVNSESTTSVRCIAQPAALC